MNDRDIATLRQALEADGAPEGLTDDQVLFLHETQRPGEDIEQGSQPPVNGHAWLALMLTLDMFVEPADKWQHADLGDGGPTIPLGLLAFMGMRYLGRPDFPTERVLEEFNEPLESVERAHGLVVQVAGEVGREPGPRD